MATDALRSLDITSSRPVLIGTPLKTNGHGSPPDTPPRSNGASSMLGDVEVLSPGKTGPATGDKTSADSKTDFHETADKTNFWVTFLFGAAAVFACLIGYEGYVWYKERTITPLILGFLWMVVTAVIGTAGEVLNETTKSKPVSVPQLEGAEAATPVVEKKYLFPGIVNSGNTCFINAPTQAIMNDSEYPQVFKEICEKSIKRHSNYKKFLELYPSQGLLSSFTWPAFLTFKKAAPLSPLVVKNVRDVLFMLKMKMSDSIYQSPDFQRKYPTISRYIGNFLKIRKEADFPNNLDADSELQAEFGLMRDDPIIVNFFYEQRAVIAQELLGFEAYQYLLEAYEKAAASKSEVVRLDSSRIRHLINGASGYSQEDVEEFLRCLTKYVLPDDYPTVFFPLSTERTWAENPGGVVMAKNHSALTVMPMNRKILEQPSPCSILQIKGFLHEGVDGKVVIQETFEARKQAEGPNDPGKTLGDYLDPIDRLAKSYYKVYERTVIDPDKMPQRIILQLVREKWNNAEQRNEKIDCTVHMHEVLPIMGHNYRLKSVVVHSSWASDPGQATKAGHYHAVLKKQNKWFYASDTAVGDAEERHIQQALEKGFLYFYEKIP